MKSFVVTSALASALLASSSLALPLAARSGSETCSAAIFDQPQLLKLTSANGQVNSFFQTSSLGAHNPNYALAAVTEQQEASTFNFQPCSYQGFSEGSSRNHDGSMGAPVEYWGRVTTQVNTHDGPATQCLTFMQQQDNWSGGSDSKIQMGFGYAPCDETLPAQWFRLQQGMGGSQLSYYPTRFNTGDQYTGENVANFYTDNPTGFGYVHATKGNVETGEYVHFVSA